MKDKAIEAVRVSECRCKDGLPPVPYRPCIHELATELLAERQRVHHVSVRMRVYGRMMEEAAQALDDASGGEHPLAKQLRDIRLRTLGGGPA